jgi:hypothetical protein
VEGPSAKHVTPHCGSLPRAWDNLRTHDPDAVAEHVAKLRVLATYLNARVVKADVPQA